MPACANPQLPNPITGDYPGRVKVSIVGPGRVGMALAYALAMRRGWFDELVLVGAHRIATGPAGKPWTCSHAHAFLRVPLDVRAGSFGRFGRFRGGRQSVRRCPMPEGLFRSQCLWRREMSELMRGLLPRDREGRLPSASIS